MCHLIRDVRPALDKLGTSLAEMVELVGAQIGDVLAGRRLAIDELAACFHHATRTPRCATRETIVAKQCHREGWRPVGEPGTVLAARRR